MSTRSDSTRPLGLVTGASTGIGRALVDEFVGAGFDVLAVADDDALEELVSADLGPGGRTVRADLATPSGNERVVEALVAEDRPVSAAALNAGVGAHGRFDQGDLADHLRVVAVNVVSPVRLAHHLLREMTARGNGRILVTSSVAARGPGPYQSTYGASKAFLHSFTEALRHEVRDTGVTLTLLEPGPTGTRFFARAGMEDSWVARGPKTDAADVAHAGFAAMMEGRRRIVPGSWALKAQDLLTPLMPEGVRSRLLGALAKPRQRG